MDVVVTPSTHPRFEVEGFLGLCYFIGMDSGFPSCRFSSPNNFSMST